jgi:DNA-binding transcriptional LysR family regulator
MKLSQITIFREVMLSGSVSQAARNLGRTQPAISTAIARLEDELGFKLFDRQGHRLHPVPEAHYLLSEASDIMERLATTERNLKNLKNLEAGNLRIVAMPGPSVFLLPRLVSRLTKGNDKIRATIITRSSPQVHQLISTQSYDLGISDLGVDSDINSSLVNITPVISNCLCAVPKNDPLADLDLIRPQDLSGRPMATLNTDHQTYRKTMEVFRDVGADFRVRYETQYFLPLLTYVEDMQACAIVDTLSAESYLRYRGASECGVAFRRFAPQIPLTFATLTPAHRAQSMLAAAFAKAWKAEVVAINARWENPLPDVLQEATDAQT